MNRAREAPPPAARRGSRRPRRPRARPRPEPADVPVGDLRAVVEPEDGTPVRVVVERPGGADSQAPGHPQVDQQRPPALEADDEVLPATLDRRDALADERRRPPRRATAASGARRGSRPARAARPRGTAPDGGGRSRPRGARAREVSLSTSSTIEPSRAGPRRRARTPTAPSPRRHPPRPRRGRAPRPAARRPRPASPRFLRQTTPTAWSTSSSFAARPAPRRSAASPTAIAPSRVTYPPRERDDLATAAPAAAPPPRGRRPAHGSTAHRRRSPSRPRPPARRAGAPSAAVDPEVGEGEQMRAASSTSSVKSAGPSPRSVSTASRTSSALPTARPSGASMSVSTQTTRARAAAERDHHPPSSRASSIVFMKAPRRP